MKSYRKLAGPPGKGLMGNVGELKRSGAQVHQTMEGWLTEYGDPCRFRLGPRPFVAVSDPAWISEIFKRRPHDFRRIDRIANIFGEMGIEGVFSAEGDDWKRQRALVLPAFRPKRIAALYPTLSGVARKLLAQCQQAAQEGQPVDILKLFMRFTVDVTTEISFGYSLNSLEAEQSEVQKHLERVFPGINRRLVASLPLWRLFRSKVDRELDESLAFLRGLMRDIVTETRAGLVNKQQAGLAPSNLLEAMLSEPGTDGATALTENELFGNMLTLLVAGEDTTSNALAWAIHHLALEPQLQEQVFEESVAVLGGAQLPESYEACLRLPLLSGVAQEVFRLRSPAPRLLFETVRDTEVQGLELPKGLAIAVMSRKPGLDASLFSRPTEFLPERWLEGSPLRGDNWRHSPRSVFAFGAGPRVCPGRSLAVFEMQLVLSMFVSHFQWVHSDSSQEVEESFAFTMSPSHLNIRLKPRVAAA